MKIVGLLLVVCGLVCVAQPPEPAFDVASVRLSDPESSPSRQGIQTSPGVLTIRHSALFTCILFAYQFQNPAQAIGPDWIHDVRLDIVAKATRAAGDRELSLMLRTLLWDRMGVIAHLEKRETAVFALTVAKGGPKFSESTTEGPPIRAQDKGEIVFQRLSMGEFAAMFSKMFGRPMVDATGLKRRYDFRVDLAALNAANPTDQVSEVDAAMIATQDQLGLKIENRRQSVDFLVIDHAEKIPTEN